MKSEFDEPTYELTWEVDHFEENGIFDWDKDVLVEKYDGYEKYSLCDTKPFDHPDPVIFQGYLDVVKHIDYPRPDNSWNVMSRKMYDALRSAGDFPHRVVGVAVVDWRVPKKDWFDSNGVLRREICLWNYLALHLTEHLDVFDREKSKYTTDSDDGYVDRIDEYAFKGSAEDLPPVFKIPEADTRTFISSTARSKLKSAGVNGTAYVSLKGYKHQKVNQVDVPIILPAGIYS